jgi:hypothetical protein
VEKRNIYYHTFLEKVFKLEGFTSADKHYDSIVNNPSYKCYFAECFDLIQEKQFWKWLGRFGEKDKTVLIEFVRIYEQLNVLIGYYLYLWIRPQNFDWMKRLDLELQVLEKLVEEYSIGRCMQPNYSKLKNPLYEQPKLNVIEKTVRPYRHQFDKKLFEELLQRHNLLDYTEACILLRNCKLPENMDKLYKELIIRMPILQESIDKFSEVYQPDMYQFYEYYIPEALQLTANYIEYLNVGIGEQIIVETEKEVLDAVDKLLIAVNDKIDEIYKFASMEIKAKAKALESLMSQDGYVNRNFKII